MKQFLLKYLLLTSVTAAVICIATTGSSADPSIWAPQSLGRLIEKGQDSLSL